MSDKVCSPIKFGTGGWRGIIGDDFIKIPRCNITVPIEPVNCHNDHRIAMSLAFLCSITGGTLIGAECVNKSYPEFFEDIKKLGVDIRII